jgi:hypothetical protein
MPGVGELVARERTARAREYVTSQLLLSREMGKRLGEIFDPALPTARLWSWLPSNVPASEFEPYDDALPRDMPQQPSVAWVVSWLKQDETPRVLIVEDDLASPSDRFIWRNDHPARDRRAFFAEDCVYWYADRDDPQDNLARVLNAASGYPGIGFVARVAPSNAFSDREPTSVATVQALAGAAEHLLVQAWDGDGWIVCDLA